MRNRRIVHWAAATLIAGSHHARIDLSSPIFKGQQAWRNPVLFCLGGTREMVSRRFLVTLIIGITAVLVAIQGQPLPPSVLASTFSAVDAGGQHTCALTTASEVQCWGQNAFGQLGDGTVVDSARPVSVSGLGTVTSLVTGAWHTCALIADGSVKCWGQNWFGQVGDGTLFDRSIPTTVCLTGSEGTCTPLTGVTAIAAGEFHTCAVTSSALKCWGLNFYGQLGNGSTVDSSNAVDVSGLSTGVAAAAAGTYHTCARTTSGAILCWGDNAGGQLGDGTNAGSLTPVGVVGMGSGIPSVAVSGNHTCALTATGGAKCWGDNAAGQLGDGTGEARSVPTDVCATGSGATCVPLTNVVAVVPGDAHTCARLTSGALQCWGWDGFGQLGDGTPSFTDLQANPAAVPGLSGGPNDPIVSVVAAGAAHTCVVTAAGVLKCWGWNSNGQLGDGTLNDRSTVVNPATDFDRDGCQDERELGSNATLGGLRNPKSHWDFFDTPDGSNTRDRVITQADIDRVGARYGTNDSGGTALINRYTDPFSAPPPTGYHPAFDRGAQNGPNTWNRAPPDGYIGVQDALAVAQQNGHSCA